MLEEIKENDIYRVVCN